MWVRLPPLPLWLKQKAGETGSPDRKWKPFAATFLLGAIVTIISGYLSFKHDGWVLRFTEHPRIAVEEVRFEENNSYILTRGVKGGIEEKVRFKVRNYGGATATVRGGDIYITGKENVKTASPTITCDINEKASVSPSGSFILPPNASQIIDVVSPVRIVSKQSLIDRMKRLEEDTLELPFAMEIYYEGEPELEFKEKLGFELKITPSFVHWNYSSH